MAMHPTGNALAAAGVERIGLGVLDMVRQLVEERVEKLLQWAPPELAVVGIDPDQPTRLVVAAEDAGRGTGVDIDLVPHEARIDFLESASEQRRECGDRRLE